MKRHAWLGLGLGLCVGLTACGGSDSDEAAPESDAGVPDYTNAIKQLRDDINGLGQMSGGLDGRLDVLETPKTPGSCSKGELCIPDGVNLVEAGLQPLVAALCAYETGCCNPGELNYLYGPAVTSAADCEATFKDLLNNGQINGPYIFEGSLQLLARAAHALNDTDVLVEIDPAGVDACTARIKAEKCAKDADDETVCTPGKLYEYDDSCSLRKMLKGLEREGDPCEPGEINECGAGLVCRDTSSDETSGQSGICSAKASAGDRCVNNDDCDDLFCESASGTCKARAKEGEACSYIDPTFTKIGAYSYLGQLQGDSFTNLDCEQGLTCNPSTNKCVKGYCAEGSFCDNNSQCPTGLVCSRLANDALNQWVQNDFVGLCAPGRAQDATCVERGIINGRHDNDCASNQCADPDANDQTTCQPALVADGQACDDGADCLSGHCGSANTCAPKCDLYCDSADCLKCAAGSFCNYGGNGYWCEPLIATSSPCNSYDQLSCASGFCSDDTDLCTAKSTNGTCPSGLPEQCPVGQGCMQGNCVAGAAVGQPCTVPESYSSGCVAGAYCWWTTPEHTAGVCAELGLDRDSLRKLPNGAECEGANEWCASGACMYDGTTYVCRDASEGTTCNPTRDAGCGDEGVCVPGETPVTGTCKKVRKTGEPCDPKLEGLECASGDCVVEHESFVCAPGGEGEIFCHESFDR
ncbi:MAG: hypothetical protein QM778_16030 [Myxococcales bacterium]